MGFYFFFFLFSFRTAFDSIEEKKKYKVHFYSMDKVTIRDDEMKWKKKETYKVNFITYTWNTVGGNTVQIILSRDLVVSERRKTSKL